MQSVAANPGPLARFADVIADPQAMVAIVQKLTDGKTLKVIAKDWAVPYGKLAQWIVEDADRTAQYEGALRIWADALAQEAIAIADEQSEAEKQGGGTYDPDVGRDKLRIETRLKIASKWDRSRYGEKVQVQHSGAPTADAGLLTAMGDILRLVAKREPRVVEVLPAPKPDVTDAELI